MGKPYATQVIVDSEWENFKHFGLPYLVCDRKFTCLVVVLGFLVNLLRGTIQNVYMVAEAGV